MRAGADAKRLRMGAWLLLLPAAFGCWLAWQPTETWLEEAWIVREGTPMQAAVVAVGTPANHSKRHSHTSVRVYPAELRLTSPQGQDVVVTAMRPLRRAAVGQEPEPPRVGEMVPVNVLGEVDPAYPPPVVPAESLVSYAQGPLTVALFWLPSAALALLAAWLLMRTPRGD